MVSSRHLFSHTSEPPAPTIRDPVVDCDVEDDDRKSPVNVTWTVSLYQCIMFMFVRIEYLLYPSVP